MSFKPEVQTDNTGNWYGNALRFATREEAEAQVLRYKADTDFKTLKQKRVDDLVTRGTLVRDVVAAGRDAAKTPVREIAEHVRITERAAHRHHHAPAGRGDHRVGRHCHGDDVGAIRRHRRTGEGVSARAQSVVDRDQSGARRARTGVL